MLLGELGVWTLLDSFSGSEAIAFAQRVEERGYSALWLPEAVGCDPFNWAAYLAGHTDGLCFATGIANIYARDPMTMKANWKTLSRLAPGRFVLGLGVSHQHLVQRARGHTYEKPLSTMRAFLDALDSSIFMGGEPESDAPIVLAALRDRMLGLAAERTAGAHPYFVTPEHTAHAREVMGPDAWLCPEQMVLLETDASKAREAARKHMAIYVGLPNYQNNLKQFGFTDEDFADGGSDELVDAIVCWGTEAQIADRIEAHRKAGADHVCIPAAGSGRAPGRSPTRRSWRRWRPPEWFGPGPAQSATGRNHGAAAISSSRSASASSPSSVSVMESRTRVTPSSSSSSTKDASGICSGSAITVTSKGSSSLRSARLRCSRRVLTISRVRSRSVAVPSQPSPKVPARRRASGPPPAIRIGTRPACRLGLEAGGSEVVEAAVELRCLLVPEATQHLDLLFEPGAAGGEVATAGAELLLEPPGAHAEQEASPGLHVEGRGSASGGEDLAQREQTDGGPDDESGGGGGDGRAGNEGVDEGPIRVEDGRVLLVDRMPDRGRSTLGIRGCSPSQTDSKPRRSASRASGTFCSGSMESVVPNFIACDPERNHGPRRARRDLQP